MSAGHVISGTPFRAALSPLAARGRPHLEDLPRESGAVSASLIDDLLEGFARDLGDILLPSLLEWFLGHPGRRFLDPGATAAHDEFVARLAAGELDRRISRTPALAHLVDVATERWSERARGVVERASIDAALLEREFGVRAPLLAASSVSDTGWRLVDAQGRAVIYKHRDLRMQSGLAEIVGWLNERGLSRDLRAAKTVCRSGYGWTEDIAARPGSGEADDRDFDVRVGMLAGLLHVMGGGDLHCGNVCRSGAYPVVLDCEKILRPLYPAERVNEAVVWLTGLLPVGHRPMQCGLAAEHWVDRPSRVTHAGTDAVRLAATRRAIDSIHESFRRAVAENLERRAGDLVRGFTEMYGALADGGVPLDALATAEARVMVRFFGHYRDVLARLLEPETLSGPDERDAALQSLLETPSAMAGFKDVRRAVERAEIHALAAGRLPRFTTPARACRIEHERALLGTPFLLSPIDKSRHIARTMDRATLARGCEEIRKSLSALSSQPSPWRANGGAWAVDGSAATAGM